MEVDTDGNGKVSRDEFYALLQNLDAQCDNSEADLLFDAMDKDGNDFIYLEEFQKSFLQMIMGQSENEEEGIFKIAFMDADEDESGTISFREFADFCNLCGCTLSLADFMQLFRVLDSQNKGEIHFDVVKGFFTEYNLLKDISWNVKLSDSQKKLGKLLQSKYQNISEDSLVCYLRGRW